jgi:small subunit ribosomal protein S3
MGQKTNPIGLRLGIIKTWQSNWYSDKNMAELLQEDLMIRRYVKSRLSRAGIAKVEIERAPKKVTITIHTARPGIVIGRKGAEVDKLRDELQHITQKDVYINIQEIRRPELDAYLIADSIARQIEQRVSFRRAMKKAITSAMRMGADGIKIKCGGRLGGAEMARIETFNDGRVPLHTLRADIDFARATAHTTYGCVGVKVWICKGEVLAGDHAESGGTPRETARSQVAATS